MRAEGTGYQCQKQSCHVPFQNGDVNYCSEKCKCEIGKGQCYSDDDCKEGLHCVRNVGSEHGLKGLSDVCEEKTILTILKLELSFSSHSMDFSLEA